MKTKSAGFVHQGKHPKKTAEVLQHPPLKGDTTQIHENKFMAG